MLYQNVPVTNKIGFWELSPCFIHRIGANWVQCLLVPTVKIYYFFMFYRLKKVISVLKYMSMNNWWQNFHFWYRFNFIINCHISHYWCSGWVRVVTIEGSHGNSPVTSSALGSIWRSRTSIALCVCGCRHI